MMLNVRGRNMLINVSVFTTTSTILTILGKTFLLKQVFLYNIVASIKKSGPYNNRYTYSKRNINNS